MMRVSSTSERKVPAGSLFLLILTVFIEHLVSIMASDGESIPRLSPIDPSSFSRPDICAVSDLHLKLDVNFDKKVLSGTAEIEVEKKTSDADHVILDAKQLTIHGITATDTGAPLNYTLGSPTGPFGSKLEIQLPNTDSKRVKITIAYETSPSASALQWMSPEMTAGKKHPYLFSQCQAIHCRSLIPCQDTSAVKFPYTAEITAPVGITVLMSAVKQADCDGESGEKIHCFEQNVPIPSYLIAIVAGALESKEIGPRSKVWTEKEMLDKAAYEFSETEEMLKTAESLVGPYVWGTYDLLILPPSFPYGGMENPCLTFVTPTLLAGDRSLADVVAHEISHSWTGNLVTNQNPEHFWLNEGHTVFLERKIAGRMFGGETLRDFKMEGGWRDLQYDINIFGKDNPLTNLNPVLTGIDPDDAFSRVPYEKGAALLYYLETKIDVFGKENPLTALIPKLTGIDPDDAFSSVPYEKGSTLLYYLEKKVGGPDVFEPFLKAYINKFKYQSITTDQWKEFLFQYFDDKVQQGVFSDVDWDAWLHQPGMPPVKPNYDTTLLDACVDLANKWGNASDADLDSFTAKEYESLKPQQKREFLSQLVAKGKLSIPKIEKMEELYKLSQVKNSEIRFMWTRLCIKARFKPIIEKALEFVTEQGRMKFVRPIYRDLYEWEEMRQKAVENYTKTRHQMHSITATMVGKDLKFGETGHDEL